jgi:2-isopropylmalate synthase
VAFIMDAEYGLDLPRRLQIEFSRTIQTITEESGTEISPDEMWDAFEQLYLRDDAGIRLLSTEIATGAKQTTVTAQVLVDDVHRTIIGVGNGPIDALVVGLRAELGLELEVLDYSEHALTAGSGASAVAYIETQGPNGEVRWGVGRDTSILDASLQAVISAANRHRDG